MMNPLVDRPTIAPSLLAADFGHIARETNDVVRAGADWLHLDIMDGHFVDNISYGPAMVDTVGKNTEAFLDVHLMISRPLHYASRFMEAGASLISFHLEADDNPTEVIASLRAGQCHVGLALNPDTPLEKAAKFLPEIDLLLLMTVQPGFGGQAFRTDVIPKIQAADEWRKREKLSYVIEVDGGITPESAAPCARAGADVFVAGTSIFGQSDREEAITQLRKVIAEAA